MSLVLKNSRSSQFPPGGWNFTNEKTGMKFNGWEGDQFYIARKVIEHRKANPKIHVAGSEGDINSVVQEIFEQKSKSHPWLFVGFADQHPAQAYPSAQSSPSQTANTDQACECGCKEVVLTYCPTCSGRRVTSSKCKSCGKDRRL